MPTILHALLATVRRSRLLSLLLGLFLLAAPAKATWSIVIVDTATGEVAIGIATCLTGFDLRPTTVVVVPGYGVAAAQSFVGPLSLRQLIRAELELGTSPSQILSLLAAADNGHQSRQYGIASISGQTATFTGSGAGAFANGITGQSGTLVYAIQGNVITGQPVLDQAEQAILNTTGTMADKLMAAMEAARLMGGDGRCSCNQGGPAACGSPPANFTKSSHIGLMIVGRPGDLNPPCTGVLGCGSGSYYMDLNVANQSAAAQDPVLQLQTLYNTWRAQQVGRPDHFRSTIAVSGNQVRSNGLDTITGTITLRDVNGALATSNPTISLRTGTGSTTNDVQFGPVVPQGNGVYTFSMTAGATPGDVVIDAVADDGRGNPVVVSPRPTIVIGDALGPCAIGAIGDGQGGVIDSLQINGSAGTNRRVNVGFAQPFNLSIAPPVGVTGGQVGAFVLWAEFGAPGPNASLNLGPGGSLCFTPWPFNPMANTLQVADSINLGSVFTATPAPWTFQVPGINALLDLTLQGAMIVDPLGSVAATNAIQLRVEALPQPTITDVTPRRATVGQAVTVTGTNFFPNSRLAINSVPTSTTNRTATSLTFTMPAGITCGGTITVTNPGGASVSTDLNPSPVITRIPFASGPAAGGAIFLISGQYLDGTTVTIGGNPMTVQAQSALSIFGTTPPGTVGTVPVVVTGPLGCQATATYTYQ